MTKRANLLGAGWLAVMLAAAPASAQTGGPSVVDPARGVTVDELVRQALDRAPEILSARSEIDVARGRLRQARLRPNPMVMPTRQEQINGGDNQTMVEVEWPLDLFRRPGRVASAERAVEATSLSVEDRERLLAAAVREQSGRVLAAARVLAVTGDVLALNRRTRDLLQARVKEGASPELDLNLVEVEVRRIEAERALRAGDVEAALVELKMLIGLAPEAPLALREDLETVVRTGAAAPAPDVAVERRPDVREAAARVQLADAELRQARREGRFDVTVYGNYARMDFGFPQRAFDVTGSLTPIHGLFHNVTVGASVMVPLLNRNQGAIAAAQAERRRAEHLMAARELAARAEIAAALARDREARRAVELYASGARDLARRNLDVVREAYELGRNPLFDVFAEQRRYLEVENAYTDALSRAYEARTALRRARGETR